MLDGNPNLLVRVHPQRNRFHISRNRTVLQVNSDGIIAPGSDDGLFVSRTRLLWCYRYFIDGEPPNTNVVGNVRQHSWLGYYISASPDQKNSEGDQGSGQDEDPRSKLSSFGFHDTSMRVCMKTLISPTLRSERLPFAWNWSSGVISQTKMNYNGKNASNKVSCATTGAKAQPDNGN